ncbi:MAG: MHS family MFS transporter [Hyphomicrobiaceae bacterium]|nr:MHS family MFS transporter [Hyphomicrobiaceae bacterium]
MAGPEIPKDFRRVIVAASVGNVIEWYDFYIFGSLAAILSVKFFEKTHPVAALLSTIALFTAGFLVRPFGAFLFGWMGDRVGRKYTFLVTLTGMGIGTGCIGLIPTFEQIGVAAAFILFGLRMIQGLCLGGEYGGAITYVAEHVSDRHRGFYTGWLQTSPTLGIVVSLAVIIATRLYFGPDFDAWAWRIPFLISFLLVAIAIYIRLQLQETPIFEEIKAKGQMTRNPWKEAFLSANIKYVLIASIVVIGQGVVWYSGQFWALYFLQQVSGIKDALVINFAVGIALLIATPTLIIYGWLSDYIGRKPVILSGFFLAALTYYPLYSWLKEVTQPAGIALWNGNFWVAVGIIAILVSYVGMVYGPIGAFLAEYFPGRIRYTSVSVPYHIGNGWGGGLVPFITSAAFASTGSIGYALLYPIAVPAVALVLALFLMPETRKISIWQPTGAKVPA